MIDAIDIFVPWTCYEDGRGSDYRGASAWLATVEREYHVATTWRHEGFWIHASLPKLVYGHNRGSIKPELIPDAISVLSQAIESDVSRCCVYRIEFGETLRVVTVPCQYMHEWVRLPWTTRATDASGQTVYFKNKRWCLYGYDKDAEQGYRSEEGFYELRIEYRRSSKLKSLFNGKQLQVLDLADPIILKHLAVVWARGYFRMEKHPAEALMIFPQTPKMLKVNLAACGLAAIGADTAIAGIDSMMKSKTITPKVAAKMRNLVADIGKYSTNGGPSLSQEVDKQVLEYARIAGATDAEILLGL